MIKPEELARITKSQLESWEANKGVLFVKKDVLIVKKVSPLRLSRLNWLAEMKRKFKQKSK